MKKFIVCLLIVFSMHASDVADFPEDLMFNGQPIHPDYMSACMDVLYCSSIDEVNFYDLKNFYQQDNVQPCFLGRDSENKIVCKNKQEWPNCFYYYLGCVEPHCYLILLYECGGGSGIFSRLFIVQREGDILRNIQYIAGGDRANGGILDASISKDFVIEVKRRVHASGMMSVCCEHYAPELVSKIADLDLCSAAQGDAGVFYCTIELLKNERETLQAIELYNPELSVEAMRQQTNSDQLIFEIVAQQYCDEQKQLLDTPAKMRQFAQDVVDMYYAQITQSRHSIWKVFNGFLGW